MLHRVFGGSREMAASLHPPLPLDKDTPHIQLLILLPSSLKCLLFSSAYLSQRYVEQVCLLHLPHKLALQIFISCVFQ